MAADDREVEFLVRAQSWCKLLHHVGIACYIRLIVGEIDWVVIVLSTSFAGSHDFVRSGESDGVRRDRQERKRKERGEKGKEQRRMKIKSEDREDRENRVDEGEAPRRPLLCGSSAHEMLTDSPDQPWKINVFPF